MPTKANIPEVLWDRVDRSQDCWVYLGRKNWGGYGLLSVRGKMWTTHRLAWTLAFGPIPTGMHVCHKCDNRPCCNPDHLWLGTMLDNIADRCAKGRSRAGVGDRHWAHLYPEHFRSVMACREQVHGEGRKGAKLTDASVREMRSAYIGGGVSQAELAKRYAVAPSVVGAVVRREIWKHVS